MVKMTKTDLEKVVVQLIKKVMGPKLNELIEEKLEEFSNEFIEAINEVIDIKVKKTLREIVGKKSLKEKMVEAAGGAESADQ